MIKKIVTFSLFVFCSLVIGILIAGFLVSKQTNDPALVASDSSMLIQDAGLPVVDNTTASTSTSTAPTKQTVILSTEMVAKHSSKQDCWQIINGKVYNFTNYMDQHPAGSETIIPYCGKEASGAFSTKGGQGSNHSDFAWKLLAKYFVGNLNQVMSVAGRSSASTVAPVNSANNAAKPTTPTPTNPKPTTPVVTPPASSLVLDSAEIAKHGTAASCWLVVSGKIYDVSAYLSKHPAGAGAITPYCGKESTAAFTGSSGGHVHSSFATGLLSKMLVGTVGQKTTSQAVQSNATQAQSAAQQSQGGGEEEEDDDDWW
jgi:cytochrome b involved in lipid metabolism